MKARRIINFGNTSSVISLPKKWLDNNKLGKGDYVNVEERTDELIISSSNAKKDKIGYIQKINLDEFDFLHIEKKIISGYVNGTVLFEFHAENISKHVIDLKRVFQKLSGFEISSQTSNKLVYQDMINYDKISASDILKRVDYVVRETFDDLKNVKSKLNCQILFEKFIDLKRTYFLFYRVLHLFCNSPTQLKNFDLNIQSTMEMFQILKNIRNICKRCTDIGFAIYDYSLSGQENRTYQNYLTKLRNLYINLMKSYYLENFGLTNQSFEELKNIDNTLQELVGSSKNQYLNKIYLGQVILVDDLKDLGNIIMNKTIQNDLLSL